MMLRKLLCQPNLEFAIYPGHVAKDFPPIFSRHVLCWRERMSVEGWICQIWYIAEFMTIYQLEEGRKIKNVRCDVERLESVRCM